MKHRLSFVAALALCFFSASNAPANAQQVKADTGGVAVGGSVTGSTINIGIPQQKVDELVREGKRPLEELTEQQRENIALLKEKLDLNLGQVRAALSIVGENNIPPERLGVKLVEIAERFKELQTIASAQPGDSPAIVSLKAEAQKAIEAGELAKADALLAEVEAEQMRALDRLAVNAAETSARRGDIALTRLRYAEAAKHFSNAAAVFPPDSAHASQRIGYLQREANAYYRQGDELGDDGALLAAIERFKKLVELMPRERVPLDWARTKNALGLALMRLGERESGSTKLEEAVVAHREALKVLTRERSPLQWANIQNSLGVALAALGSRGGGVAKFEEAIVAYREALTERTRERLPLKWAKIQANLGNALAAIATRETGTAKLDEAVAAYSEALKELTRERVPLDWARSFGSQGAVLIILAERSGDASVAERALSQINAAFETLRDAGHAAYAVRYERDLLPRARATVARLRGG